METVEQLEQILESLLFTSGRPMKAKDLAKVLELEEGQVKTALTQMVETKKDSGIVLLESAEGYQLATNSKFSTQVKNFLNAELREKLTDATVEVLAIIAYRQPISKAEIEAIRGVNSQYSIRNLLMRGMIEKVANPNDSRSVCYQTTTEFLMHMGINSSKDLPEFEKLVEQIKLPETPQLKQDLIPAVERPTTQPQIQESSDPVSEPAETAAESLPEPEEVKGELDDEEENEDSDDEDDDDEDEN